MGGLVNVRGPALFFAIISMGIIGTTLILMMLMIIILDAS